MIQLTDGSVVVMLGAKIQSKWKHSVPRDDSLQEERWNVSMRFHLLQEQVQQVSNVCKLTSKPSLDKVFKVLNY